MSASVAGLFSGQNDTRTVAELREQLIGDVKLSMSRMFDDLVLTGLGEPLNKGTFYFQKGTSTDFHYKNLSGGEKAAFDLILDIIVKQMEFDNTVYCIDEPEAHMHARLQGRILQELVSLIPVNSQLWIATHSIGMMRKAKQLKAASPESVVFLDFHDNDFDNPVVLVPQTVNREFWMSTLGIALDDLADLVAPSRVVLCEGRLTGGSSSVRSEFDAQCYRKIFAEEFYDTDFLSVGNSSDVESDRLGFGRSIQTLLKGTEIVRLVDRDDKSPQEVTDLRAAGFRVLSRRHLESFLLDEEIIKKLCDCAKQSARVPDAVEAKQKAITESQSRGNAPDDIKSASGQIYVELKRLLGITGCGNTSEAFLRDTMAPLVTRDTDTYKALRADIFG